MEAMAGTPNVFLGSFREVRYKQSSVAGGYLHISRRLHKNVSKKQSIFLMKYKVVVELH